MDELIIDAHNHPNWKGHNLERFIENMDKFNIDKTWLLSRETPSDESDPRSLYVYPDFGEDGPLSFRNCLSFYERRPDRFVLGYAPDPRRPDAIDRLHSAINLYGVRICGEIKLRMMYDNPDAIRMYRFCGEKGLPVTVHIDYEFDTGSKYPRPNWWYGGGIDAFERAVKKCPDTYFIGHAPGFWAHISGDDQFDKVPYPKGKVEPGGDVVRMLRQYPNLYCDISAGSGCNAFERDPEFAKPFILEFQDRILYGRDNFNNQHQDMLSKLDLPEDVLDKIYYKNALKLVPLD
ncbi:amidohydrolase family protein [Paenibacillus koleovorans]|uniref:amidohydrolase family protein n=1 Tax=Paenibacillus koleovorans TaxID=121608 RepID=UPI000FD92132|nr:amidohydrolase family protein [Paenibacillus koleovorans]